MTDSVKRRRKQYLESAFRTIPRTTQNRWKKFNYTETVLSSLKQTRSDSNETKADFERGTYNNLQLSSSSESLSDISNISSDDVATAFETSFDSRNDHVGGGLGNEDDIGNEDEIRNQPEPPDDDLSDIMFPQSGLNKAAVLTMIQAIALKHHLTNEARNDILEFTKICANNSFSTSSYMMSKLFDPDNDTFTYVYYCKECKTQVKTTTRCEIQNETVTCPNASCKMTQKICLQNETMFVMVDPATQIKSIIKNNLETLQEPNINSENCIHDIFDSELYKKNKESMEFDLTYNFSTDGAPIFASSKKSMWPIQLIINELPPKIRFRHRIIAGVWVGLGEPNVHLMNTIMNSFVEQAKKLLEEGVNVELSNGQTKNFKFLPLACPCDSVARPLLQNRYQYNGRYGCSWCYQKGETFKKQIKYPFMEEESRMLRSHNSHLQDLQEVINSNYTLSVRGVKGPSSLSVNLPGIDSVWSFPVDYMHGVVLGVTKQLWDIWTTYSEESKNKFYLGRPAILQKINKRITSITPPHEIHRLPRTINERGKWKASEWRSFLLFYSLPCLQGILNEPYLDHLALLVVSIFKLLQKSIPRTELSEAQKDLHLFVKNFETLYGASTMTFNVHSMLHIAESVKQCGPLWANSTFPFEAGNFTIKQQIKGPVGVTKQIVTKMHGKNTLLIELNGNNNLTDTCKTFCENLFSTVHANKHIYKLHEVTYLGAREFLTNENMKRYIPSSDTIILHSGYSYQRCIYKDILIHSQDYTRTKKNNNSTFQTIAGDFIVVVKLLVYNNHNYVFAKKLEVKLGKFGNVTTTHIFQIEEWSQETLFVPIEIIKQKCIYIKVDERFDYICIMPNSFEIQ